VVIAFIKPRSGRVAEVLADEFTHEALRTDELHVLLLALALLAAETEKIGNHQLFVAFQRPWAAQAFADMTGGLVQNGIIQIVTAADARSQAGRHRVSYAGTRAVARVSEMPFQEVHPMAVRRPHQG
jgi:hypothetical protein